LRHDGRIIHMQKTSENRVVAVACTAPLEKERRVRKSNDSSRNEWLSGKVSRYKRPTVMSLLPYCCQGKNISYVWYTSKTRIYPSDDCIIIYIFQSRKHTCRDILLTSFWGIFFQYPFFWLQYNITNKANEFIPFSCWSFSLIGYYDDVCSLSFGSLNNRLFKCLKSTLILEYTKKNLKNRVVAVACPSLERNARVKVTIVHETDWAGWGKSQHSCHYFLTAAKVRAFW
jgi:hypothetical protein